VRAFFLSLIFLVSAIAVFGSTTGVSPCATATLAAYDSSYAPPSLGCSIGILDYSNFAYVDLSNAPAASDINVTPNSQGFGFTRVDSNPFVAAAGEIVRFAIYYRIFIDPAPVIAGANSSLDPPQGNVNITEYFCNDSFLDQGQTTCFPPTSTAYSLTVTTANRTASINFATPAQSFETVGLIFTLDGTNGPASFDGLDTTSNVVTPEPASLLLVGLFLAGGAYRARRRRRI
jgi:hypothetical protein